MAQGPTPDEVLLQLRRILASSSWSGSARLSRFLTHTVQTSLRGDTDSLNQYAIGLEVFDKPDSFDPNLDPIVRVEAGRLRRMLELYYAVEGKDDPIRIRFANRGYATTFLHAEASAPALATPVPIDAQIPAIAPVVPERSGVVTIAIFPFDDLTPDRDEGAFCDGLAAELTTTLTALETVRVVSRRASQRFQRGAYDFKEVQSSLQADAVIEGSVRKFQERLRITAELNSVRDGFVLWAGTSTWNHRDLLLIHESICRAIVDALQSLFPANHH